MLKSDRLDEFNGLWEDQRPKEAGWLQFCLTLGPKPHLEPRHGVSVIQVRSIIKLDCDWSINPKHA